MAGRQAVDRLDHIVGIGRLEARALGDADSDRFPNRRLEQLPACRHLP